jgi:hypothetical protein
LKALNNFSIDNNLLNALQKAANNAQLKDFYTIGLWNYCEGDRNKDGTEIITSCSPHNANFWFNPVEVWKLDGAAGQKIFTNEMQKGLNAYHRAARWMCSAYIIAIVLTAAEFVVGLTAIFSRWGSLVTTVISTVNYTPYFNSNHELTTP